METENKNLLIEGAKTFGILLDGKATEAFDLYLKELLRWNRKINLTSIRSEKEIVLKHFLDSLSVYPLLPKNSSVLDMGSGAGFPGIPLKIVHPTLEVTLIDSVQKKVDFQKHIIRMLGLKGIETIHGRVQDNAIIQQWGEKFNITVSRAFSELRTLLILSFPFLREGGKVIAMKGKGEGDKAQVLMGIEGTPYQLQETISLVLPFSSYKRTLHIFKKR